MCGLLPGASWSLCPLPLMLQVQVAGAGSVTVCTWTLSRRQGTYERAQVISAGRQHATHTLGPSHHQP